MGGSSIFSMVAAVLVLLGIAGYYSYQMYIKMSLDMATDDTTEDEIKAELQEAGEALLEDEISSVFSKLATVNANSTDTIGIQTMIRMIFFMRTTLVSIKAKNAGAVGSVLSRLYCITKVLHDGTTDGRTPSTDVHSTASNEVCYLSTSRVRGRGRVGVRVRPLYLH